MDTLIVYYSDFGNTRRLAEEMAGVAASVGRARAVRIEELEAADLDSADLVVMGSPTHYQNLPKVFRDALATLPRRALAGKPVAAFDTSVETWGALMRLTAAHRLRRVLRRLGGKPVVKGETFLVKQRDREDQGEQDLLYDGEVERARDWLRSILKVSVATGG